MKTKEQGFYAINGNRVVVGEGQIVSYPDDAIIEEFETITKLDEKYPEPIEEIEEEVDNAIIDDIS